MNRGYERWSSFFHSSSIRNCFYVKKCLGKNRKTIYIYKFRTMELNADKRLDEILRGAFDSYGKPVVDPRITPIGKFLRRYWIDELPQLYNLLVGDIKLVGIRPMGEVEWERYPEDIMDRALKQKPGLMGVQYAFPNENDFNKHLDRLKLYLNMWDENHIRTDLIYLSKITNNIILKGTRSS